MQYGACYGTSYVARSAETLETIFGEATWGVSGLVGCLLPSARRCSRVLGLVRVLLAILAALAPARPSAFTIVFTLTHTVLNACVPGLVIRNKTVCCCSGCS